MVAAALAALRVARAASMVACAASAAVWRASAAALKVFIWAWNAVRAATRSAFVAAVSAANEVVVEVSAKPAISRAATAVREFFMVSLSMCAGLMPLLMGTYCAATFRNLCDDFAKSVRVYSRAS